MNRRFILLLISVLVFAVAAQTAWVAATRNGPALTTPVTTTAKSVIIGSLNLAMVTDSAAIVKELESIPALRDADLLLFQEVVRESGGSVAEDVAKRMRREAAFASPDEKTAQTKGGVAILSKSSLSDVVIRKLKPENLIFRSRRRIALGGTAQTAVGPVRVVTTHLDTRINPGERLAQLEPALDIARAFSGPSLIGGDFNTNDMQWVSNVVPVPFPNWQASRVRSLMDSRGFHTPFTTRQPTFDHLGMQLDWIFTNTLRPLASGIVPMEFSDHHAVWAQFTLQ